MATAWTAVRGSLQRGWRLRRWGLQFLLGGLFLAGSASAWGAPAASKMLEYRPRHDAPVTTPTATELSGCKVELDKDKSGGGSAWVLKDSSGRLLRRFYSRDGRNVDTYSYYRDGVEVYREMVSPGSRVPDQFRWLNSGGSKWGIDEDKNGTIDTWKMISAEEVSQEVLRALATRDLNRFQVLLLTDDDIRALGLSSDLAESLRARRKDLKSKFEATISKLPKLTEKANWQHLETSAPQCIPAEQTGSSKDIIRYSRATVLFESGGSSEWFQVGPMIKVGNTWKVIDAPTPGAAVEERPEGGLTGRGVVDLASDPKLQKLVEELTTLDKKAGSIGPMGQEAAVHHLHRADILERIVAAVQPKERDPWIRQVADSLSSAVQAAPTNATAGTRLASLEKQLVQHMPGSNLAAYVCFRRMQAEYSSKLSGDSKSINFSDVQKEWLEKLTSFVKTYPKAEDTPDAMLQLGMVCEFLGKEVEAKNWYSTLARTFPDKVQGKKGDGAYRRLSLEGQIVQLAGSTLSEGGAPFDIEQMRGKLVIVYYWASWNGQAASDFTKLKGILRDNKDVELLGVNLDAKLEDAKAFMAKNPVVGTHLHEPGGLDSKLGTQYGVMVLPSIILVGKDGKCLNKAAQIGSLEEDVKKHLQKK